MLKIIRHFDELNISQLFCVYEQSIAQESMDHYPNLPANLQLIQAEQDFCSYLRVFFKNPTAFNAIWETEGTYKAALRMEHYDDGLIITALETAPEARRMGYASDLVAGVLDYVAGQGIKRVYSHVDKKNTASLRLHEKCGFAHCLDYAVYLDGSVLRNSCTLCIMLK